MRALLEPLAALGRLTHARTPTPAHSRPPLTHASSIGIPGVAALFDFADQPLTVPAGSGMLFSGRMRHQGVRVTQGERLILAGFVGLNGPPGAVERVGAAVSDAGGYSCPRDQLLSRPYLRYNAEQLRQLAGGATGEALVRMLADRRVKAPYDDYARLAAACRRWLSTGFLAQWTAGKDPNRPWELSSKYGPLKIKYTPARHTSFKYHARFIIDTVGSAEVESRLRQANASVASEEERQTLILSWEAFETAKVGEWTGWPD